MGHDTLDEDCSSSIVNERHDAVLVPSDVEHGESVNEIGRIKRSAHISGRPPIHAFGRIRPIK
jgi:hypothetical protein